MKDQKSSKRKRKEKKPLYLAGTKSISEPKFADPLYDSLAARIEKHKSVAVWSYKRKDARVRVVIQFVDEDTTLDVAVNSLNIKDLQSAIESIDAYLMLKQQRS